MKKTLLYLIIASLILFLQSCSDDDPVKVNNENNLSDLLLNEICPNNATVIKDENGNAGDWVEFYNEGIKDIDLQGAKIKYSYYEGDTKLEFEYVIPVELIIPAKGFEIIWCDAQNNGVHTNFELQTANGGKISLYDKNNKLIDSYDYSDTPVTNDVTDVSIARYPLNGLPTWRMFGPGYEWWPTPRQANTVEIPIPQT